jgi:hypothetical protein
MKHKKQTYTEITKMDTVVKLLGDDNVIFYIKKGVDNYVPCSKRDVIESEHKNLVYLIRQSKLFYTLT